MAMIEVKLLSLTCEFADSEEGGLDLTGTLSAQTFDDPAVIKTTNIIFDFPDGPIRLRKGESVTLDRDVRVAMATPIVDPGFGELFVKFGGDLIDKDIAPDTDDLLGSEWQTLHTNDISQPEPRLWHFYFGRNNQVARADFATRFVHPL